MLRVFVLRLYALMLFCIMPQVTVSMVLQKRLGDGSIETVGKSPSNNTDLYKFSKSLELHTSNWKTRLVRVLGRCRV